MPAGHAGAVEVADHVQVPLDVLQQIALHDLHVVAIEQELQTRGVEPRQRAAPRSLPVSQ